MKNILSELVSQCPVVHLFQLVFGIAALVSGVAFVVSLIVEARKMGLKV